MYDRRLVAGGAAIALVAVAIIAFVLAAPGWSVAGLNSLAQQQLGRSVKVRGSTHLGFSPLSVRLDDAVLSGASPDDDSFATVKSATIPVTLGQLFGCKPQPAAITLTDAEIALLIDERGQANWDFPDLKLHGPMRINLEQARFRYYDARNDQAMSLAHVDGALDITPEGGASFSGSAVINGRLVRIDADLKSIARVNADGSPLELALAADDGAANFSGRLATAKVLSLAGPISLSSDKPAAGLRLLGLPLAEDTAVAGPIAIEGALDSAGRAFAIRNATIAAGSFHAVGDIAADLRSDQPKLQANLTADALKLDGFVPASGAQGGDWGRVPLPFAALKSIDAELNLSAKSLAYMDATTGPANLGVTLTGGKLETLIAAQLPGAGTLSVTAKADATATPPAVSLSVDAQDSAVQPLLGALTGARQLTGTGDFSADVSATGTTEEELLGTLKGTANIGIANGRVAGVDFGGLFLAVKQKILDGWSAAPGGTPFDNLNGDATIADGIITFRELKMEAPALTVSVEGIVDLLRQGLAVSATAFTNGQPLLPVPVIARGLWAKPKIYPDIPDILNNPEGGYARLQDAAPVQGN